MKYSTNNQPIVCMQTQSTCYKGTTVGRPVGILWHDTGAGNPYIKRYVQPSDNDVNRASLLNLLGKNAYANDWNHITQQAGLNAWVGKLADGAVAAVQSMPWNYRPWGCGSGSKGSCNGSHSVSNSPFWIQFEICDDGYGDASYFAKAYKEACELTAYLCRLYGISPNGTVSYNGVTVPTILCHQDSYKLGLGSDHGDVYLWFNKYGKTMANVRADVAALLGSSGSGSGSGSGGSTATTSYKAGDVVKITGSAYYNGKSVPAWVKAKNWIVHSASGDRIVINKSEDGVNAIMSPFKASDLALANIAPSTNAGGNDEPANPGCYASTVIAVAQNELGYYEKASNSNLDDKTANKGSANYTKYARDFDQKYPNWYNGKKNGYAWCDMFVDWCFLTAFGYEKALYLLCQPEKSAGAGCTYSLRYYKAKGQFYTGNPKAGDQIFFGTSVDNSTHTGLVEKVEGGKVYTIEGNTSDMVARRTYAIGASNIVGYGRPNYDGAGSVVMPEPSTGGSGHSVLRKGSTGDEVKELQQKLTTLGYSLGAIDGDFGDKTLAAVKKFQQDYSLDVDGVVGNQTWTALDKAVVAKSSTGTSYRVKVTTDALNIRAGAGTSYAIVGCIRDKGVYTIVEQKSNWGRLKSSAGWICLDYTKKV